MSFQDVVLVRYGEITLKDRWTRHSWERLLASNLAFDLRKSGLEHRVARSEGRIFIHTPDPGAPRIAARVFGVVSASPAQTVLADIGDISQAAADMAMRIKPRTFAIRPKRSGGSISSETIGREAGEAVRMATGAAVDLEDPELEIYVEARQDKAYLFTEILKGPGGLPLGSGGRMVALISGGIDSSVAAWMMMRRGCPVSLLHFDSRPYADALAQSMRSAEVLSQWASGRKIRFIHVPIAPGIEKIASHYPRATCVLCRRLMYRIATEVARKEKALGIVTGYSLGQVASQTPENIMAEQAGIELPVYHPLIAMDKTEIMDLARKIGTYQITESTRPCSAVPRKPMTNARLGEIVALEEELGLWDMARALAAEMILTKI
jgi:thiamine biosynthesis protein ThiI